MRKKGVEEAWDALEEMQQNGITTDRFTVSRMLMRTLADARRYWDAAKINRSVGAVKRFLAQQPDEADEVLFNALLDTHCRMKDIAGLESTFNTMRTLKIEPSHVTLGILVKAYGQACDIKSVLRLWDEMQDQRQQANAVTYGCMINACVRCGQNQKAVEIFEEMKSLKKHCNTILYTTLIKGYGNEKDIKNALRLFAEMQQENVPYNTIAYNSIIDVCIKCSDVSAAEEIFSEMLLPDSPVQPDLITYSTLLKGYCQVGNLDKALQVAETIKACGLRCDELVYNTLMDGCVKANDLSAGVGLFAEMMQNGMKPSSITHSIFLRLYQRNGYKGNAGDAVAQLYQHHGLERPMSNDKPSRVRGKNKMALPPQKQQNPVGGPCGGGYDGYDRMPPQVPYMPPPRPAPVAPGYVQASYPGQWQRQPGCPPHADGCNGCRPPIHCGPPGPGVPLVNRGTPDSMGILSSPSTYGGMMMDRPPCPPVYGNHPVHAPPGRGVPPMHMEYQPGVQYTPMHAHPPPPPLPPYHQQGYMNGAHASGPCYSPHGPAQDCYDAPFPSLLLQQRQQEEYMDRYHYDSARYAMGHPNTNVPRKPMNACGVY